MIALLTAAATPLLADAGGTTPELGRVRSELGAMAELVNRRLGPATQQLAGDLPGQRDRLGRLREPAATAQAQLKVALAQLQEMSTLVLDPHYGPALIAVGRAYSAVSGQDPLTGTTINPEYAGLERELTVDREGLDRSATTAAALSAEVKRLRGLLARARRQARG